MITWNTPAPIRYGTALRGAQLNTTASVPGTFAYTPPAGTVLHAGSQTLTVTFTPADTTAYPTATRTVTLTATPLTPVITWNAPAAIPYGTALSSTQPNAKTKISGAFTYSPAAGAVVGVGTQTLSVTFTPTDAIDYTTAMRTVTLTVTVATPVITWTPAAIPYGTALSGLQLNATANASGTFAYTPPAGSVLPASMQMLSVTFTPANTVDYTTATSTVTLNVAIPGASGGGNEYPLQFTPASAARGLVVAGYQLVADPVVGYTVIGNCSLARNARTVQAGAPPAKPCATSGVLGVVRVDKSRATFKVIAGALHDVGAANVLATRKSFASFVRWIHAFTELNPPCVDHVSVPW